MKSAIADALIGIVVLGSLAVGVTPGEATPLDDDTIARVDAFVESQMRDAGIPGVALAIVEGDRAVHLRGFGVADSSGRPVTPQTPFPIASLSKTFTALAVMQLVEAGRLALDVPVRTYIPWFDVGHDPASAVITIRELLMQRSGIAGDVDVTAYNDADRGQAALENNVRQFATRERLLTSPGTSFNYCDANYDALGLLIEVVSGESYEAYLQKHVLSPLDMTHSYTSLADARGQGLAAGYYRWWGVPLETDMLPRGRASVASAALASSIEDLSHWLIAQLGDGRYLDRTVLSANGIATLQRPLGGSEFNQYAMGWYVSPAWDATLLRGDASAYDIPAMLIAGGILPTHHGSLELFPDRRLAFAVVTNTYDGTAPLRYEYVDRGIRSILLGKEPGPIDLDDAWLRYLKVILVGLIALEAVAGTWSLRRWRTHSHSVRVALIAGGVFAAALAFAFGYVPMQVRSFLVGVALGRLSDISIMALVLIATPLAWALGLVVARRFRSADA